MPRKSPKLLTNKGIKTELVAFKQPEEKKLPNLVYVLRRRQFETIDLDKTIWFHASSINFKL